MWTYSLKSFTYPLSKFIFSAYAFISFSDIFPSPFVSIWLNIARIHPCTTSSGFELIACCRKSCSFFRSINSCFLFFLYCLDFFDTLPMIVLLPPPPPPPPPPSSSYSSSSVSSYSSLEEAFGISKSTCCMNRSFSSSDMLL